MHITSGDSAGEMLADSGVPGKILVWHPILYDGPRNPGYTLQVRTGLLEEASGAGPDREDIRATLRHQYTSLDSADAVPPVVLV